MSGKRRLLMRIQRKILKTHTHNYSQSNKNILIFKMIELVVVMSAVKLWKPLQQPLSIGHNRVFAKWRFVKIVEN
jgi:hypothetical protein